MTFNARTGFFCSNPWRRDFFPRSNFCLCGREQFRPINTRQLTFAFFEMPRDLGPKDTLSDLPEIEFIFTFGNKFLDPSEFFPEKFIILASQPLANSVWRLSFFEDIDLT